MKLLIVGINGFAGTHLAKLASKQGHTVFGISRSKNLNKHLVDLDIEYHQCDLLDTSELTKLKGMFEKIDSIINLAAIAKVGESSGAEEKYRNANVLTHINLLECLDNFNIYPSILCVSSAAVYNPDQDMPLKENSRVLSIEEGLAYNKSKVELEEKVLDYTDKFKIAIARPFNHTGPFQETGFLLPDLVSKVKNAKKNKQSSISTGNLSSKRDYTDVRDVVDAYMKIISSDYNSGDIINVCSGKSYSGYQILDKVTDTIGYVIEVESDNKLIRSFDPSNIYGSNDILSNKFNWKRKYSIDQTINDYIDSLVLEK